MRKLTLEQFQQKLNNVHPKEQLQALNYNGDSNDCDVKCLTCGSCYTKKAGYFVDKRKVSICKKCFFIRAYDQRLQTAVILFFRQYCLLFYVKYVSNYFNKFLDKRDYIC